MKEPVRNTLSSQVTEQIKQYIIENDLKPGDRIPTETELIEMLGVSRATVREAVKQIQMYGILDVRQGQGATIKDFNMDEAIAHAAWGLHVMMDHESLKDLFEARYILEMAVLPLVIERIEEQDLIKLRDLTEVMSRSKTVSKRRKIDTLFHRTLIESSKSKMLSQMGIIVLEFFLRLQKINPNHMFPASSEGKPFFKHELIYDAITKKEISRLEEVMEQHFQHYKTYFKRENTHDDE